MSNSSENLIEVHDLKVDFNLLEGVVHALNGVDFEVKYGKSLGIIGESGCGKSVTAQSIMRIVPTPPAKVVGGKITLHLKGETGQPIEDIDILGLESSGSQMRNIRWKHVAMIFQEPMTSFSPVFTIGNQIIEAVLLHVPGATKDSARQRAIDVLGRVGIPKPNRLVDAYPHQLSGGMRQRAMIAMALSCNPKLLIADEPTTALDVTIEAQILELLKELQAEFGMSMMYISHDLAVVGEMSDDIMVMYLGQVMERATTDELFADPKHPYTQALWRSIPRIEGNQERLTPISGTLPSPFSQHRGCPFASRCEHRIDGLCDTQRPPMYQISPTHQVSCFLYQP
ncbi:MAG: ABC transporter ATP-binding protein [Anaerolineae bacterium]|nr:ABC transporter ATP-binding protein [Anaerolineae bacterium]